MSTGELKILPLGGLGEIGMNCMVIEYQDEIVVVDCGLLFSDLEQFGVEFAIPDFTYLLERKEKVKAFLITHGHEDHIGALAFAIKAGINAPIYASQFTSLMIRERMKEHGLDSQIDLRPFKMGERFGFKHFQVETVSVNHSIIDAAALFIDTPLGKVIHTGDFRMDWTPFYGNPIDLKKFAKAGDDGVLLLMSDSTNVERHEHSLSESVILQRFEQLFAAAEGLTVVSMFSSNVARMGQIFKLAQLMDKRIALSGRSVEQNVRLSQQLGYLEHADSVLIGMDQIDSFPRDKIIVISTGSQGEYRSSLVRIANGEHAHIELREGDQVLMSSRSIPGNEKPIGHMINQLFKQGANVVYEAVNEIHASGHATHPELKKMLELTKPRFFVPIHGEYRHLVHHARLAREMGMRPENVVTAVNGDYIEVTKDLCRIVDHQDEARVLVEGREGGDISKLVLKERRQMGETGVVFSLLVRNRETRRVMAGPELVFKGLASDEIEADLLPKAKRHVQRLLIEYDQELRDPSGHRTNLTQDLQETVRVELRRFFNQHLGKKPVVMPIILDL